MKPREHDTAAIEERAADWLGRHDGGLTTDEQADFERWLLADPRHADAFARLEGYSHALDRLAILRGADAPRLATAPAARPGRRSRRLLPVSALAAAAALALVATFGWRQWTQRPFDQIASTTVGESRRLVLPDRSAIDLNTDTEIAVDYTSQARTIDLRRGEAHFVVARDANRPFVVRTGGVAVRAIGTAFNVRRHADKVEVLVTHGRVDVQDAREGRSLLTPAATETTPALAAGQRIVVTAAPADSLVAPMPAPVENIPAPEIVRRLAWQERRLEFGPTPLDEIVTEFNRYSHRRLVIADPEIATLSVGGTFQAGDVDTLVQLLESSFGIVSERRGETTFLRRAAAAPSNP